MLSAVSGCWLQGEPRQKAPDGARPLGSEMGWIVAAEHCCNARRAASVPAKKTALDRVQLPSKAAPSSCGMCTRTPYRYLTFSLQCATARPVGAGLCRLGRARGCWLLAGAEQNLVTT
jgi:hypothetical protein